MRANAWLEVSVVLSVVLGIASLSTAEAVAMAKAAEAAGGTGAGDVAVDDELGVRAAVGDAAHAEVDAGVAAGVVELLDQLAFLVLHAVGVHQEYQLVLIPQNE